MNLAQTLADLISLRVFGRVRSVGRRRARLCRRGVIEAHEDIDFLFDADHTSRLDWPRSVFLVGRFTVTADDRRASIEGMIWRR